MTPQTIFNRVCEHLTTQKRRASHKGDCLYRGPNGTKCAAGCLISDSVYKPEMEYTAASTLPHHFPLPAFFTKNVELIDALQQVHDSCHPRSWKKAMRTVAEVCGLDEPVCIQQ